MTAKGTTIFRGNLRDNNALVQVGKTIFPKVLKNNNIETP